MYCVRFYGNVETYGQSVYCVRFYGNVETYGQSVHCVRFYGNVETYYYYNSAFCTVMFRYGHYQHN